MKKKFYHENRENTKDVEIAEAIKRKNEQEADELTSILDSSRTNKNKSEDQKKGNRYGLCVSHESKHLLGKKEQESQGTSIHTYATQNQPSTDSPVQKEPTYAQATSKSSSGVSPELHHLINKSPYSGAPPERPSRKSSFTSEESNEKRISTITHLSSTPRTTSPIWIKGAITMSPKWDKAPVTTSTSKRDDIDSKEKKPWLIPEKDIHKGNYIGKEGRTPC